MIFFTGNKNYANCGCKKLIILSNTNLLLEALPTKQCAGLSTFSAIGFFGYFGMNLHDEMDLYAYKKGMDELMTPMFGSLENIVEYICEEHTYEPDLSICVAVAEDSISAAKELLRLCGDKNMKTKIMSLSL